MVLCNFTILFIHRGLIMPIFIVIAVIAVIGIVLLVTKLKSSSSDAPAPVVSNPEPTPAIGSAPIIPVVNPSDPNDAGNIIRGTVPVPDSNNPPE